jgi:hypothetical protein
VEWQPCGHADVGGFCGYRIRITTPEHEASLARARAILDADLKEQERRRCSVPPVAAAHERVANARDDFQHGLSKRLVDKNQAIIKSPRVSDAGAGRVPQSAVWRRAICVEQGARDQEAPLSRLAGFDGHSLQQACLGLGRAFTNFFEGRARFPRLRVAIERSLTCAGSKGAVAQEERIEEPS